MSLFFTTTQGKKVTLTNWVWHWNKVDIWDFQSRHNNRDRNNGGQGQEEEVTRTGRGGNRDRKRRQSWQARWELDRQLYLRNRGHTFTTEVWGWTGTNGNTCILRPVVESTCPYGAYILNRGVRKLTNKWIKCTQPLTVVSPMIKSKLGSGKQLLG